MWAWVGIWVVLGQPTTHEIKNAIKTVRVNGSNGCHCAVVFAFVVVVMRCYSRSLSLPFPLQQNSDVFMHVCEYLRTRTPTQIFRHIHVCRWKIAAPL